jgi:hypothetical protein
MKTTIDLPAEVIRDLKLYNLQRRQKLGVSLLEILRAGMLSKETKQGFAKKTLPKLKITPLAKNQVAHLSSQAMSDWVHEQEMHVDEEAFRP